MAAKKKQAVEKVVEQAPVELPVQEIPVEALTGTCIQCRWLETGTWFGPRCTNPASPEYHTHRADAGTCAEFSPKIRQPISQPLPEVEDGLYDPEPAKSDLAALLDRETESPEAAEDV